MVISVKNIDILVSEIYKVVKSTLNEAIEVHMNSKFKSLFTQWLCYIQRESQKKYHS